MPQANQLIAQLEHIQLVSEVSLLGEIIYDLGYAPVAGNSDASLLVQAAIVIPGGLGLVLWDRDEYLAILENIGPEHQQARLRFTPFEEAPTAFKAMLLPQVEPLLKRLILRAMPVQMRTESPRSQGLGQLDSN